MAFGFFRKRRKMVITIMAGLMLVFVLSLVWRNPGDLFQGSPGRQAVGRSSEGPVRVNDISLAASDLYILTSYIHLGDPQRMTPQEVWPGDVEYMQLLTNGRKENLVLALLEQEARKLGVSVTEADVDAFLMQAGLSGAEFQGLLSRLKSTERGVSGADLRGAIARWLLVNKAFTSALAEAPPADQEMRHLFRQLAEQIKLRVVKVPASLFVKGVGEPSEEDIQEQFNRFREVFPAAYLRRLQEVAPEYMHGRIQEDFARAYPDHSAFGFGYRQGDRVEVRYLFVDRDVIKRVARPSEIEVLEYYRAHRNEFTKQVPVIRSGAGKPASAPAAAGADRKDRPATSPGTAATGPATTPASKGAEMRTVLKEPDEAEDEIVEKLSEGAVNDNVESVANAAHALLAGLVALSKGTGEDPYQQVVKQMTLPARNVLQRVIPKAAVTNIRNVALDKAVEMLAEAAELRGICYPWGEHGDFKVDPQVKVTLECGDEGLTLWEALDAVTRQVFGPSATTQAATQPATHPAAGAATQPASQPAAHPSSAPRLEWAMCAGFKSGGRDVLFCIDGGSGLGMFPITAGKTPPLDRAQLVRHEILGAGALSHREGESLVEIVFQAKEFQSDAETQSLARVGEDGPMMDVSGKKRGKLLWRLLNAVPAYSPAEVKDVEDLRRQVIEDIKIARAFEQARKVAKDIAAAKSTLEDAAKDRDLQTFETDMFARQTLLPRHLLISRRAQFMMMMGRVPVEYYMARPCAFVPTPVKDVPLPTGTISRYFMDEAFALAPKDIEPPYPPGPGPVSVVPLPSAAEVLVVQRVDYRPPVAREYEEGGRVLLARALLEIRRWRARVAWFNYRDVEKRMGFREEESKAKKGEGREKPREEPEPEPSGTDL